jgi:hypothetical protein
MSLLPDRFPARSKTEDLQGDSKGRGEAVDCPAQTLSEN